MKNLLCQLVVNMACLTALCQPIPADQGKRPIDRDAFANWPEIQSPTLSNNGSVAAYTIFTEGSGSTLVLQATDNSWRREFSGAYNVNFTADSRYAVFSKSADSIAIVNTKTQRLQLFHGNSYGIAGQGNAKWLAYAYNGQGANELILHDLSRGKETRFHQVSTYLFSNQGEVLLLQRKPQQGNLPVELLWFELATGKSQVIYQGSQPAENIVFNAGQTAVAFTTKDTAGNGACLQYYHTGMKAAVVRAGPGSPGLGREMTVASAKVEFSANGRKIFFRLERQRSTDSQLQSDTVAKVDVWSYFDNRLQSQQKLEAKRESDRKFLAVIVEGSPMVIRLEEQGDDWTTLETAGGGNGQFVLLRTKDDWSQSDWRPSVRAKIYLVSTETGKRIQVQDHYLQGGFAKMLSPEGKYVIWYDRQLMGYFTYNVATGQIKNITDKIPVPLYNDEEDRPRKPYEFGIAGWSQQDRTILLYDRYDIWKVDPDGLRPPVNITNGYGRRNRTILRYKSTDETAWQHSITIDGDEPMLLVGLNRDTKDNGLFLKRSQQAGDPQLLMEGPYIAFYNFYPMPSFNMTPTVILKAKNANTYLFQKMSATQFPNLFATSNFKKVTQLSFLAPEKGYNWLTAELMRWQTFDGKAAEGILYKPENFDPGKKYPVIFYFYEKDANGLHNYLRPNWSDGQINIPYFVSHGYLVFDANIYYTPGRTRESVYNSVVSAARQLSRMPWVDSTKMGVQGHSFGGYEVNCLVSRTPMFAAAVSAAGFSDLVSMYGNLRSAFGVTGLNWIEKGQTGLGATLWENREAYIENSPVFYADKVTTPLLIMHNKSDGAAPFSQSMEYFHALRRLGKKVWLLQYDQEDHQLSGHANLMDYTRRLKQFYDHYLKGAPATSWMINPGPGGSKAYDSGTGADGWTRGK